MVHKDLNFDPQKDLHPVEPFGSIDLKESFSSGVVPTQVPDSEVNYNGMEDPAQVLGKPEDIFEAMQMESSINSFNPDADSKNDE